MKIFMAPSRIWSSPNPDGDAEVQAESDPVGRMGLQRVQDIAGRHQLNPGLQEAAASGFGVGGEFHGAAADPAGADAGLHHVCQAFRRVDLARRADRVCQIRHGVGDYQCGDQLLGLFLK